MKILILNPPFVRGYCVARWDSVSVSGSHWPPIFLASLTGLLEKEGHECKFVDAQAGNLDSGEALEIAKSFMPDFTVMQPTLASIGANEVLARRIYEVTGSRVIYVGPWCSMIDWDRHEASFVVRGEFEFAVLDIVEGRITKRVTDAGRLTQEQLNKLPWVTKTYAKHLDLKDYKISSLYYPFMDMFVGSRKCVWAEKSGGCSFCLYPTSIFKGKSKATRKLDDVLDEIEWAAPQVTELFFQDGTVSARRLEEIAEGIIERGIKVAWSAYARGDLELTPAVLQKMRQSGCHVLHVGCESSNNRILEGMNKGVTHQMIETAVKEMYDTGIDVHGDFLFGLPGETKETMKETVEWAKSLPISLYQFAIPKPYPGTPLYRQLQESGNLNDGHPNYPDLSFDELETSARAAIRSCHLNRRYLFRMLRNPDYAVSVARAGFSAVPWMTWKRWEKQ